MVSGSAAAGPDISAIAREAAAAIAEGRQIQRFSARQRPLTLAEAYRVLAEMRRLRGARVVGRKIGFTNRGIWPRYGVTAPIWGDVTEHTLFQLSDLEAGLSLQGLCEPRIEPEIVLGLGAVPTADMDEAALFGCVDWIAPGFEIVQSIYPGWRFDTADTIVANGLHGLLLAGERVDAAEVERDDLPDLTVQLLRDGSEVERGRGANVLGGPVAALRHLVRLLAEDPGNPPLAAGEIVSTGTLTDAWPLSRGETWRAEFSGVPLAPASLRLIQD